MGITIDLRIISWSVLPVLPMDRSEGSISRNIRTLLVKYENLSYLNIQLPQFIFHRILRSIVCQGIGSMEHRKPEKVINQLLPVAIWRQQNIVFPRSSNSWYWAIPFGIFFCRHVDRNLHLDVLPLEFKLPCHFELVDRTICCFWIDVHWGNCDLLHEIWEFHLCFHNCNSISRVSNQV